MSGYSFANWETATKIFAFTHLLNNSGVKVNVMILANKDEVDMRDHFYYCNYRLDEDLKVIIDVPQGTTEERSLASVITDGDKQEFLLLTRSRVSYERFKRLFLNGGSEEGSNIDKLINESDIFIVIELSEFPG